MEMIDIEMLIKPINSTQRTGINLRSDASTNSLYYQIKDARRVARHTERKYMLQESTHDGHDHWQKVYELALDILQYNSKDLEILAWFIEALLRKFGLPGLSAGLLLSARLITEYWHELYPEIDEDGIEIKIAALIGLNGDDAPGCLIAPINNLSISAASSHREFKLWQYRQALEISQMSSQEKQIKRIETIGYSLIDIKQAALESGEAYYQELNSEVTKTLTALKTLSVAIADQSQLFVFPTSAINNALIAFQDHVRFLQADFSLEIENQESPITPSSNNNMTCHDGTSNSKLPKIIGKKIKTRREALIQIHEIAEYFDSTEPHSPLPYLLRKAARWGDLSLPDLLTELITEEKYKEQVFQLAGIIND